MSKNNPNLPTVEKMWDYRKEKLAIKIEKSVDTYYKMDCFTVLVSSNGYQFSTITVYGKDELKQLAGLINREVSKL